MTAPVYIRRFFLLLLAGCLPAILFGCGKKGDLTLKSYEKPDAPAALSAVHREGALILRWDYPKSRETLIAEFIVLRSGGSAFEKLSYIAPSQRSYEDKDITTGLSYSYKVISRNYRGVYSDDSNTVTAAPVRVQEQPTGLSYTIGDNAVLLRWDSRRVGERYNVYKSDKKGIYGLVPINASPLSEPGFRDSFSVNAIVYYTVRSLSDSVIRDEGPASDELVVDPADLIPSKPEHLDAYAAPDRVILSWREFDELWVAGFRVYRKAAAGDFVLIGKTQVPTFVDPDAPVSPRDYRVTAMGPVKEGPPAEIRNVIHIPQR